MAKGCKALIDFLSKEKRIKLKKDRTVHIERGDFSFFCIRNLGEDGEIELDLRILFQNKKKSVSAS